jgi:carbon storage regulator
MLVMSRKKNESIVINNDITVTVVEIRGDKVRLGIVAPREASVHRQEVYEAIHGRPSYPVEDVSAPFPTWLPSPPLPPEPTRGETISVNQLINDLGATDADVERGARFTSEGGLNPAGASRRRKLESGQE